MTPQRIAEILASVNGNVVGESLANVCHDAAAELRRREVVNAQLREITQKLTNLQQAFTVLRRCFDGSEGTSRERIDGLSDEAVTEDMNVFLGRKPPEPAPDLAHNKTPSEHAGTSA